MLPVCSATPTRSAHSTGGGLGFFTSSPKDILFRCHVKDKSFLLISDGTHWKRSSFKPKAIKSFYAFAESAEQSVSTDITGKHSCLNAWNSVAETAHEVHPAAGGSFKYIEAFGLSAAEGELVDFTDQISKNSNETIRETSETILSVDMTSVSLGIASEPLKLDTNPLASVTSSLDNFLMGMKDSVSSSMNKGENILKNSLDKITSSLSLISKSASEALDTALSRVFSAVDQTGESVSNKFSSLSGDLKEASSKAPVIALDLLRQTIVFVEDSLSTGTSYLVFSYNSAKGQLPQQIRDALNLSEDKVTESLKPVVAVFQEVYMAIEGVTYWIWTYGGYAGNLSPKSTLELLSGEENAVLIDIRPEVLREKDGIPDLRRAARFHYASVTLPEVDSSVRKLLKSGKDLEDSLIAAVIQNLKIIQDRSKVIVMDADGTHSKGVARSLRKFGLKKAFLVQGGFRNWMIEGLRVKKLKPETTLTILKEEAEAIFEDINPSPVQLLGYGVAAVAALYALTEWEKTLQFVGVIGLGQTIYRRVAGYEGPEVFRKDVSMLLAPLSLGAQAFSWAAGKLENSRIGLPTSPSSLDVQNRVLQAAAKHESQPSDTERIQDPSPEPMAQMSENMDVSEA